MTDPPAGHTPLDRECAALLRQLQIRCPHLLPARPVPPGVPGRPIPVDREAVGAAVVVAARQAAATAATGGLPSTDDALPEVVLWADLDAAIAVELARIGIRTADGQVTVGVPVRCDQLPDERGWVRVTFAVGTRARPAGLIAATPGRPEGPDEVVRRWGDALVALCWRALLDAAAGIAAVSGADTDGAALIVAAVTASPDGLEILPQARHRFDRLPAGRAVRPL